MNENENRSLLRKFTENMKILFSKYSVIRLLAWIEGLSVFFGFITLLPGKSNHIKEFPSMNAIFNRLILSIVIPLIVVVIGVGILYISQFGTAKNDRSKE